MVSVKAKKLAPTDGMLSRHAAAPAASGWADAARASARARLESVGAPQRRDEYWSFTNPTRFVSDQPTAAQPLVTDEAAIFADANALVLTFVDGIFDAAQSGDLSVEGLEIQSLTDALGTDIHWAKDLFGVLEERGQNPVPRELAMLNTALC